MTYKTNETKLLDNNEFVLSKLQEAIDSARSLDLGDTLISSILGLLTVFLALGTILPPSIVGFIRFLLLIATGFAMLILYFVVRRLITNRRMRLKILRKWQADTFFARAQVDLLEQNKVRKMLDLIQSVEEARTITLRYSQFDVEFMNLLK